MPKRNIELLTQIRNLVVSEPEKLDMSSWSEISAEDLGRFLDKDERVKVDCGTTQCVAGWALQLNGYKFLIDGSRSEDGAYYATECVARNGRVCDIEDRAREMLGLTHDEAGLLFLNTSDEDVVDVLNDFIAGKTLHEIEFGEPE